jgi:hypothetical protein
MEEYWRKAAGIVLIEMGDGSTVVLRRWPWTTLEGRDGSTTHGGRDGGASVRWKTKNRNHDLCVCG